MENAVAVITQEQAKISCNFEQVKEAIQGTLAEYRDAVFTEDSKALAKKHVAALRAQKKTFQDNLRESKKEYMKPWDEFESSARLLIGMYDEPIDLINGQVQAFEEKRIQEKKKLIAGIYHEIVAGVLEEYIPLDRIYNPKWENATCREKEIRAQISETARKTEADIASIQGMKSEAEGQALHIYRTTLDISAAVQSVTLYERQKQEILAKERERAQAEAEERARREEREKMLAEQRAKEAQEAALRRAEAEKQEALRRAEAEREELMQQAEERRLAAVEQAREEAAREVVESLVPDTEGETSMWEYTMTLTADAKEKLEMYLDSVGIDYAAEEVEGF